MARKKTKTSAVKSQGDFLRVLVKRRKRPGDMRKLIDLASKEEIDACSEILLNAFRGNISLTPRLIKKISKSKRECEQLISKNVSLGRKKRILKGQVGGFIPELIASLASSLITPIIKGIAGSISRAR